MKRPSILMLITFLFGIFIVLALHIAAPKKENHKHAGFERVFAPDDILQPLDTLNLGRQGYYFAGTDSSQVFLANNYSVGYVLELNTENLRDTTYHFIKADSLQYFSVKVHVTPPYFYLIDGNLPFIYKGNTTNWIATSHLDNIYFASALPISDSSFALIRITNFKSDFYKVSKRKPEPELFPGLLKEQYGDGVFSTYGRLYFDKKAERLIYVYLYRNEYLYMNTHFRLLYRGNTIDTISQAKIKVGEIHSENKIALSAPALKVNITSCVYDNYLYNNSNLLASNEEVGQFEKASVIDVYNLKDGSYKYSFYLPPYEKKKLKAFKIIENHTVALALYDNKMVSYRLNLSLFKPGDLLN